MEVTMTKLEQSSSSQICRLCATIGTQFIPIFDGEGAEHQLCEKIHKHLPIHISETDVLPLNVCYHCASTIIAWNELSDGCLKVQRQLEQIQEKQSNSTNLSTSYHSERSTKTQPFKDYLTQNANLKTGEKPTSTSNQNDLKQESTGSWNSVSEPSSESSNDTLNPTDSNDLDESGTDKVVENVDKQNQINQGIQSQEQTKKNPVQNTYRCNECGRAFKLKDSFLRHMRIHKNERPFTCHVCGKQFRDSGGLSRHLKDVHAKLKNFPCDICGNSFASKATRDDHRRTHTGERPYVCDSCGKTFKSKASLYIHSKLHTDEFPHPCTYCSKQFRRRHELLAHITTHTGEKNHPCDICSKRFRVKSELVRHKLVHSKEKPFTCAICSLAFRQKRYLNSHMRSRHADVDKSIMQSDSSVS